MPTEPTKPTKSIEPIEFEYVKEILTIALMEDLGPGDVTTEACIKENKKTTARIIAKADGIICGLDLIPFVFDLIDEKIDLELNVKDGDLVKKGDLILTVGARSHALLCTERTLLNFIQRLSGIATTASTYAEKIKAYKTKILDTRKTTPGMRYLEKYAVKCGGAENHRMGLYDMVLIKDNHIKACGSITEAVLLAKERYPDLLVEVECDSLNQVREATKTNCDWIMLDNMDPLKVKEAMSFIKNKKIECSGGMTLENIEDYARLGVDYISVGALTHSFESLDLSMKFD